MKNKFLNHAGWSLLIGTFMIVVTMILHPAGDLDAEGVALIMSTHALAILSIPISLTGYWGLTKKLGSKNTLSIIAFMIVTTGLITAIIGGVCSGFIYPIFSESFHPTTQIQAEVKDAIIDYNFSINQSMILIYACAMSISMLLWSIRIVYSKRLSPWLGYLGLFISLSFLTLILTGFKLTDLLGFRIFIFGSVFWTIFTGILLIKASKS